MVNSDWWIIAERFATRRTTLTGEPKNKWKVYKVYKVRKCLVFDVLRTDRPRLVNQKTREKSVKKHPLFEPQSGEFGGFSFLNVSFLSEAGAVLNASVKWGQSQACLNYAEREFFMQNKREKR